MGANPSVRCVWGVLLLALLVACLSGCGGRKPVPVEGVVTLDDKPLAKASVVFVPEAADGQQATGFTDEKGHFRLMTENNDGVFPGTYNVVIQATGEADDVPAHLKTPEEIQKGYATGEVKVKKRPIVIPNTKLKQEVPPTGPVKFELKSTPK